ncbi:MAG: acetoin utilization protein AcuC [Gammaproteobacteria bacterium]
MPESDVCVFTGEKLAGYGFGADHPFNNERLQAFLNEFENRASGRTVRLCQPSTASQQDIELFHDHYYVEFVKNKSAIGYGYLDSGDTPVVPYIYEAASTVVGTVLKAVNALVDGLCKRAFVPIAGLHHARRDSAAGFCVFNDCGVAIEYLRRKYSLTRIAYIDIDAHHGDGVFYSFENDEELFIADYHEDGHFLYPGTGHQDETGTGPAVGTKLNIPLPPETGDKQFLTSWSRVEQFILDSKAEFFILQCGADCLAGDPITHLRLSSATHNLVVSSVCRIADQLGHGRVLALGGGGYNPENIAKAWCAVVDALKNS